MSRKLLGKMDFDSITPIGPGETRLVSTRAEVLLKAFAGEPLASIGSFDDTEYGAFTINAMCVGYVLQWHISETRPATWFIGGFDSLPSVTHCGIDVTLQVTNNSDLPKSFALRLIGHVLK